LFYVPYYELIRLLIPEGRGICMTGFSIAEALNTKAEQDSKESRPAIKEVSYA